MRSTRRCLRLSQTETQRQFVSTDYSYYSFLADTRLSAHPVIDRIILQIWGDKMHPTVKWRHVFCSWAEPIGHVTSVAGDNGSACWSRRGYTQLVQFLEGGSQITEMPVVLRKNAESCEPTMASPQRARGRGRAREVGGPSPSLAINFG